MEKTKEEWQRFFAKWLIPGYLCVGVFAPWYMFLFNFDLFSVIFVALLELLCILSILRISLYAYKEIYKFLKRKLEGEAVL